MNKPKEVALTADQERKWGETRTLLAWVCPAFTHIFYEMLHNNDSKHIAIFTEEVPVAATDGSNLMINPVEFFKLTLPQRVFVIAHEIAHCVFDHCRQFRRCALTGKVSYADGTSLPWAMVEGDPPTTLANIAADLVINDMLVQSKVGEFKKADPSKGEAGWLHDPNIATHKDSWMDAYRKLYKESKKGGGGGGMKPPTSGQRFDEHLAPGTSQGKDAQQASQDRSDAAWGTAIAAAANIGRLQGKLPAAMEHFFNQVLNPAVDWREHIQGLFARKMGSGGYDFFRPDEELVSRGLYAPSRSGYGAECVVLAADTSNSIGPKELDMFFAEMAGILEDVKPRRMLVMWCDAQVHRVDEAEDASDLNWIRHKGAPGRGGTDFCPVFEKISELGLKPDALVYLTDGQGSFPSEAPDYPVIWGNIYPESKYPFGDVVEVPKQAA